MAVYPVLWSFDRVTTRLWRTCSDCIIFLKVDCCVLFIFSLNLVLDFPTWFWGSNSLRRKQILCCPLNRDVVRHFTLVVRHRFDNYCLVKGSRVNCCVFLFFLSFNLPWTETWLLGRNSIQWMWMLRDPSTVLLCGIPCRFGDATLKIIV